VRQVYTNIDTGPQFDPSAGAQRLQAPGPKQYKSAPVQQHFEDNYAPQAHQNAMEFSRAATGNAANYHQAATQAQNQSVLGGLGLLNTQMRNAYQRQNAAQDMAYGWMNDMVGGMGNVLRGLL
jgi:hypothetical protein